MRAAPAAPAISSSMICRPGPLPRSQAPRPCRNHAASISADGHFVVYQSDASDGHSEIYLYDLSTGHVVFHTANASGASYNPVISPDGHFIIFASDAQLTSDDTTPSPIPMWSMSPILPTLSSSWSRPMAGNAASNLGASISAGGLFVAFASSASDLSTRHRWHR